MTDVGYSTTFDPNLSKTSANIYFCSRKINILVLFFTFLYLHCSAKFENHHFLTLTSYIN